MGLPLLGNERWGVRCNPRPAARVTYQQHAVTAGQNQGSLSSTRPRGPVKDTLGLLSDVALPRLLRPCAQTDSER